MTFMSSSRRFDALKKVTPQTASRSFRVAVARRLPNKAIQRTRRRRRPHLAADCQIVGQTMVPIMAQQKRSAGRASATPCAAELACLGGPS
ncbi:hypothetical protein BE11_28760 [Sorangium cellulosum]|nr:hypothetical protein BE11_28760 [Sorangium cellulosum]